jgi:chromosome partitioning protein
MAKVITLAARKGGSGKSTIAASLAVAAHQAGEGVVILDLDPQRSLKDWHDRRELPGIHYREDYADTLADRLARIHAHAATTLVVIDTAGDFSPAVTAALSASDLTIVPVKGLRTLKRKHAFVVSQAMPTAPARVEEAARILVRTAPLAQAIISTRADYLDAMMMGQGVTEYAPTGRAAEEIRALWTWAKDELEAGE